VAQLITEDGPVDICDGCHQPIDVNARDTVDAVAIKDVGNFVNPHEIAEGFRAWFHAACYIGEPYYRRVERPAA
jgi:hypothetical protein